MSDNSSVFVARDTDLTTITINNLSPNTQYIAYASAITRSGDRKVESEAGETLVAWTDPAFPAFVEVRLIRASAEKHNFESFVSSASCNYS